MLTLEEIFPPFGLRITCEDLELRVLRDEDFPELVELVQAGISVAGLPMPFLHAWHEEPFAPGTPDGFPTASLSWWWAQRSAFAPKHWNLALAVWFRGELVGMQDLMARDFPVARSVSSGSWLGRAHHGQGMGTLMRQMAVGFAFDELDALACHSGYVVGNHASAAVSRRTGYVDNGRARIAQHTRDGAMGVDEQRVVVTPQTYHRPEAPVVCEGTEALRRFFGIERPRDAAHHPLPSS